MTAEQNTTELEGPQKVALVILGLDPDVAAMLLREMEEEDLRLLATAVKQTDGLAPELLGPVLEELERELCGPVIPPGHQRYVKRLTAMAHGDDYADRVFAPPVVPDDAVNVLQAAQASTLAQLLSEEHPQVCAAVLSQLSKEHAAEVVLAFPAELQIDVIRRMSSMEELPAHALAIATETIADALKQSGATTSVAEGNEFDGLAFTASMMNAMVADQSEGLLENIEDEDPDLYPKIRDAMFTFEDLSRLDKRSLQVVMREVPSDLMLVAFKTASEELREKLLSAVSKRAAELMREDLEIMAPKRLSEVEAAQREVLETVMQLGSDGSITMPTSGEEVV